MPAFSEREVHWSRGAPRRPSYKEGPRRPRHKLFPGGEGCGTTPPHLAMIGPHRWFRNLSVYLQLRSPEDAAHDPPSHYHLSRCGKPIPTYWGSKFQDVLPVDRRGPFMVQISLHDLTCQARWVRKTNTPGWPTPRMVRKTQPHGHIAVRLGRQKRSIITRRTQAPILWS